MPLCSLQQLSVDLQEGGSSVLKGKGRLRFLMAFCERCLAITDTCMVYLVMRWLNTADKDLLNRIGRNENA